ncbi:putative membrane protein [Burkholderia sp. MSHR3999]|uniref:hypothetical protein n=1 Tax=Burkholderia sp. MSHR3999 TaxID=1542965 RepID=UPI0005AC4D8E|nr:hypothetical protein [Burkholderia sp. MSHR3999]KIP13474.1 putative membrane protein [Burkholderia sp. MSHR3999]
MKPISRLLLIVLVTAAFSLVAWQFPGILSKDAVRYLSAIFVGVTSVLTVFFTQMNNVTGVGILTGREMERYVAVRSGIRSRFWFVLAVCVASSFIMWILSTKRVSSIDYIQGLAVGFLVGVGLNYLLVVLRWINDLWEFADQLRLIEQRKRDQETALKRLADAAK